MQQVEPFLAKVVDAIGSYRYLGNIVKAMLRGSFCKLSGTAQPNSNGFRLRDKRRTFFVDSCGEKERN